ncbi:MAG: hypothetical protein ACOX5R_09575 [bacterium]|jgi:truncated hemoglobin YjbI
MASEAKLRVEDQNLGFFLEWHGGTLFKCIKQNGQKLGEWHEDHEPSPEEAERILEEMKETGAYLNIIE